MILPRCSLVCKSWVPSSRLHLFASLSLLRFDLDTTIDVLGPGSTVSAYVHHLKITDGCVEPYDPKWVADALPKLPLSELTALESLELNSFSWDAMAHSAIGCLSALAPRLKILELICVDFDTYTQAIELISAARSLESLTLSGISFKDNDDNIPFFQYSAPPSLRVIKFTTDYTALLDWLRLSQHFASVTTLTLDMVEWKRIPSMSAFLRSLGPVLENLTLSLFDPNPSGGCLFS